MNKQDEVSHSPHSRADGRDQPVLAFRLLDHLQPFKPGMSAAATCQRRCSVSAEIERNAESKRSLAQLACIISCDCMQWYSSFPRDAATTPAPSAPA